MPSPFPSANVRAVLRQLRPNFLSAPKRSRPARFPCIIAGEGDPIGGALSSCDFLCRRPPGTVTSTWDREWGNAPPERFPTLLRSISARLIRILRRAAAEGFDDALSEVLREYGVLRMPCIEKVADPPYPTSPVPMRRSRGRDPPGQLAVLIPESTPSAFSDSRRRRCSTITKPRLHHIRGGLSPAWILRMQQARQGLRPFPNLAHPNPYLR